MLASCLKRKQDDSNWNDPNDKNKLRTVTFADFAGQSLETVKTITPNSSCEDFHKERNLTFPASLRKCDYNILKDQGSASINNILRISSSSLPQPLFGKDFAELFERNSICLEHLFLASSSKNVLVGIVRVKNHTYKKDVFVRYTWNEWEDFQDGTADFLFQCDGGYADKFFFRIAVPSKRFTVRQETHGKIELAICCNMHRTLYWDNNNGRNYIVNY